VKTDRHTFEDLGWDAATRIPDRETHVGPGGESAARHGLRLSQVDALEKHAERAAVLHGMHRIRAEVHRDLMQVGRIADERGIAGGQGFFQPDVGRQRGRNEFQVSSITDWM